jgi:hypothetical protein
MGLLPLTRPTRKGAAHTISQLWVRRPYYAETVTPTTLAKEPNALSLIREFFRAVLAELNKLQRIGAAHGHITFGNIVRYNGSFILVDHLLASYSPSSFNELDDLAPEIRKNGELPQPASDLFGIGVLLASVMHLVPNEERVRWHKLAHQLLYLSPEKRPSILEIEKIIVGTPTSSVRIISGSSNTLLQGTPLQGTLLQGKIVPKSSQVEETTSTEHSNKEKLKSYAKHANLQQYLLGAIIAITLLIFSWRYFTTTKEIPLEAYWKSNDVPLMQEVAERAINHEDQEAINIITSSAISNSAPKLINSAIIRVGWDSRWRNNLTSDDLRLLLTVALAPLLTANNRSVYLSDSVHPGILFAFLATSDISSNGDHFARFSPNYLSSLPQPIGALFEKLANIGINSIENSTVRAASHLLVGDISAVTWDSYFDTNDSDALSLAKLDALTPLIFTDKSVGEVLYKILESRDGPGRLLLEWFTQPTLAQWKEVRPLDRLKIVLGQIPPNITSFEQLVDLLTFPRNTIRNQVVLLLKKENKLRASPNLIPFLADSRASGLTRAELISLLAAITGTGDFSESLLNEWFKQTPSPSLVLKLLTLYQGAEEIDAFQLQAAKYLTSNREKITPTDEDLTKLSLHVEPLARALAYSFLNNENPSHRLIIEESLKQERVPRLKKALQNKTENR